MAAARLGHINAFGRRRRALCAIRIDGPERAFSPGAERGKRRAASAFWRLGRGQGGGQAHDGAKRGRLPSGISQLDFFSRSSYFFSARANTRATRKETAVNPSMPALFVKPALLYFGFFFFGFTKTCGGVSG